MVFINNWTDFTDFDLQGWAPERQEKGVLVISSIVKKSQSKCMQMEIFVIWPGDTKNRGWLGETFKNFFLHSPKFAIFFFRIVIWQICEGHWFYTGHDRKDTRLKVYIWQPFEARIILTWRPGLQIKYWYLRSVIKYWDPRSAVQTVTPQVCSSNTETLGLQLKYWDPRSGVQILRPQVCSSWNADRGSRYLTLRPWVSVFDLQTWGLGIWTGDLGCHCLNSRPGVSVFDHRPEVSVFDPQTWASGLDNPSFKWLPNIHCKSGVLPVIW